jgi:hypothetical protein
MRVKMMALALALAVGAPAVPGCSRERESNRWATTENTTVKIDWDKVNEAYKQADGPADLERRINEIYEGDEVISISVHDQGAKTQVVTGFFDKNANGSVEDPEKVFTIKREITGEGEGQYQTVGHGAYYGYHSPVMSLVSGMLLGSMLSNAFSPRYVPAYTTPYTTPSGRIGELNAQRSSYRAQNPARFQGKASRTGRTYGNPSGRPTGGGKSFGRRFGRR